MKAITLSMELLHKRDVYWRATKYLLVGQIYLYDNPLLKRPHLLPEGEGTHRQAHTNSAE
jgi:xylulose-5-phosphate/fructose-6-phosphate phosphoketolase